MPTDATRIQAVIFDLDDTLYPERDYVRSGYAAVGRHLRKELSSGEAFEDWLWGRFCTGRADRAFDALGRHFQLHLSQGRIAELVKIYREHRPCIKPFPGMVELLGRLHATRRLGLLSDGFLPAQRLKLQALKLERFFDAVVFTEEMGRRFWKPSPAGFERIGELLGIPHERCAYVADNAGKDFQAPNALGWRTIQVRRPGQIHADQAAAEGGQPQAIVRLPGELHEALL